MNELQKITSPEQLLSFMSNIEYKWKDKKGILHSKQVPEMYNTYSMMSPDEVLKTMCGICVDQCELERYWFEQKNYQFKIMNIQLYRNDSSPGHVFAIYEQTGKYYWFENAWHDERGIHEYNSYEELIEDIKNKFIKQNKITNDELENMIIRQWLKYPYHISYEEIDELDAMNNKSKKN